MTVSFPDDQNNQSIGQNNGTLDVQITSSSHQKEVLPASEFGEKTVITEIKEPEPSKEMDTWLEKLEKGESVQLPQPITDDYGQILVSSAAPAAVQIVLPLTDNEIQQGIKEKVVNSFRWLAFWCLRLLKMAPERVKSKKT